MTKRNNCTITQGGFELPTKGLIYDVEVNPIIELRSMTVAEELRRQNPSNTPMKTLADIVEDCMLEKPAIHVYDMALGDYEYLLHKLRIISYSDEYKMSVGCPHCGETVDIVKNLSELEVKDFNLNEFEKLRTVVLPKSGDKIKLNFQTPRMVDETDMKTKEFKRKYKDIKINPELLVTLSNIIGEVNGEVYSYMELENYIKRLPVLDMSTILQSAGKLNDSIGLDTTFYADCPQCGKEILTFFRFGPEFFRPTL